MTSLFGSNLRRIALFLYAAAVLSACDSFQKPERFYDEDAQPPRLAPLSFAELQDGQHIAGTIQLTLDVDSLAGQIERVEIAIDERVVETIRIAPYAFDLDTSSYPDGTHTLSASVYLRRDNLGLLGLLDAPSLVLTTSVVFDQTIPPARDVTAATWEDDVIRVTWSESQAPNFYAYLVARRTDWRNPSPSELVVVDTVFERSMTSYTDPDVPQIYGSRTEYRIAVWNRAAVSPFGEGKAVYRGTHLPEAQPTTQAVFSTSGEIMYAASQGDVVVLNTVTNEVLSRLEAQNYGGPDAQFIRVRSNPSRSLLYAAMEDDRSDGGLRYFVLDAQSLDVLQVMNPPSGIRSLGVGHDGRLYGADDFDLYIFDGATGETLEYLEGFFAYDTSVFDASPDGLTIYLTASNPAPDTATLSRLDVSGQSPKQTGAFEYRSSVRSGRQVSTRFFVIDDAILVKSSGGTPGTVIVELDSETLQQRRGIDLKLTSEESLRQFYVASGRLYVGLDLYVGGSVENRIAEYDFGTLQRTRSWDFIFDVTEINTSGRHHLYVSTTERLDPPNYEDTGWALPL